MYRSRNWMVTIYNDILPQLTDKITYFIGQKEICPKTKKEHWQGYIELNTPITMTGLKKEIVNKEAHIEPRKGNQKQAIAYVTKTETAKPGTVIEFGRKKEQGKRNDLADAIELINLGCPINEIIDTIPQMIKYDKHLERYEQRKIEPRNFQTEVEIIIGEPGSGKTRYVYDNNKTNKIWTMPEGSSGTQWFDGYKGQEIVLIDDFKGNIRYNFLLQLLDRYPMQVNIKGGYTQWRPKKIYITSNYEPQEWYQQDITALNRRITHVHKFCTQVTGNTKAVTICDDLFE